VTGDDVKLLARKLPDLQADLDAFEASLHPPKDSGENLSTGA